MTTPCRVHTFDRSQRKNGDTAFCIECNFPILWDRLGDLPLYNTVLPSDPRSRQVSMLVIDDPTKDAKEEVTMATKGKGGNNWAKYEKLEARKPEILKAWREAPDGRTLNEEITSVAKKLGMPNTTLRGKLVQWGIITRSKRKVSKTSPTGPGALEEVRLLLGHTIEEMVKADSEVVRLDAEMEALRTTMRLLEAKAANAKA